MPIVSVADWAAIIDVAKAASARFVFLNTLQRRGPARVAAGLDIPVLGVVHNPDLFRNDADCMALAKTGRLHLVGLAPHVRDAIKKAVPAIGDQAYAHFPYDWTPDDYTPKRTYRKVRKICIPGAVDYANRDYEGLVSYLAQADLDDAAPFKIQILTGGRDLDRLKQDVRDNRIGKYFHFADKDPEFPQTPHSAYLKNLYDCDVCLALLGNLRIEPYLTSKITTGIMAAIGMGMPIIAQKKVGAVYGFTPIETPGDMGYDIAGADLSPGRLRDLGDAAMAIKEDGLRKNREILEPVIRKLLRAVSPKAAPAPAEQPPVARNTAHVLVEDRTLDGFSPVTTSDADFLDFAQNMIDVAAGQQFQDLFGLWQSGLKRNGYFLEFGALNGITASNSYLMEQLGWTGIIAEPHPNYGKHLRRRNCHISYDCVWTKSNEEVTFKLVEGRPALSTISGLDYEDIQEKAGFRDNFKEVKVKTISLEDLLVQFKAPAYIDFFSLDTEGSEFPILESFDFSKYIFGTITVEHNFSRQREDIHRVLSLNGYVRTWAHISDHDDWYVHASTLSNSVRSAETWRDFVLNLPDLPLADMHADRCRRLAKVLGARGDAVAAARLLERFLTMSGDSAAMRQSLAEMQEKAGLLIDSAANYKRALDLDPKLVQAARKLERLQGG